MNQGPLESLLPPSLSFAFLPCHSRKNLFELSLQGWLYLQKFLTHENLLLGLGGPLPSEGLVDKLAMSYF